MGELPILVTLPTSCLGFSALAIIADRVTTDLSSQIVAANALNQVRLVSGSKTGRMLTTRVKMIPSVQDPFYISHCGGHAI
jgi:hypothetical protein